MKPITKDTSFKFMDYVKNADRILRLLGRIFLVLLVFWILWAFRKAIKDESYVFDTFSVPPALIEKGYNNDVVINKILAEMQMILSEKYYDEQNPEAYRKVLYRPDLNFSAGSRAGYFDLHALFQVGKALMGKKDKTIKGDIIVDSNSVKLSLHLPDGLIPPLSIHNKKPLDSLFHESAVSLIRQTSPQYLLYYYLDRQQFSEAGILLQEIDFKLNNNRKSPTYDYDRIQWFMSNTNLLLAQQDFEGAIAKAEELQKNYPNDLASYAQTLNILMSQVVYLENQSSTDTASFVPIAQRASRVAETIEKKGFSSIFLDKTMAMGWTYANWAYMLQKCGSDDKNILAKYQKAIDLLPRASFAYNNLSYFYMDKKNYTAAEEILKKAILAEPNDGNSWDTYAEVMALKGDDARFFAYLEKALQNRNPTEGITAELYAQDNRWAKYKQQKKFQDLLKKYWR